MDINITALPDFSALAAIHAACFDRPWNTQAFAEMFQVSGSLAFASADNSGFGVLRIAGDEAEIITLAVLPEKRRSGIAGSIVTAMLETAEMRKISSIFLEVRKSNAAACALYHAYGFAMLSKRKDYYTNSDGTCEDAIIMKKGL